MRTVYLTSLIRSQDYQRHPGPFILMFTVYLPLILPACFSRCQDPQSPGLPHLLVIGAALPSPRFVRYGRSPAGAIFHSQGCQMRSRITPASDPLTLLSCNDTYLPTLLAVPVSDAFSLPVRLFSR
jgi:hypothetical protein